MALPPPVPTFDEEEVETFLQELEAFEVSEEQRESFDRHREALREDDA